jgi:hypothetical protein
VVTVIQPKTYVDAVGRHARSTRRNAGRLLFSGVGFSLAYFFDPVQGPARRKRASEFVSSRLGQVKVDPDGTLSVAHSNGRSNEQPQFTTNGLAHLPA